MTTYSRRAIAGSIFWIASLPLIRAQSVSIYSSIVGTDYQVFRLRWWP